MSSPPKAARRRCTCRSALLPVFTATIPGGHRLFPRRQALMATIARDRLRLLSTVLPCCASLRAMVPSMSRMTSGPRFPRRAPGPPTMWCAWRSSSSAAVVLSIVNESASPTRAISMLVRPALTTDRPKRPAT